MNTTRNDSAYPTGERVRADIDSGVTGEKVSASDPAMAPLGTDDEAAGTPLTRKQIAIETAAQPRVEPAGENSSSALAVFAVSIAAVAIAIVALAYWLGKG